MASRFITIEYHNGNKDKVKEYYSTVFFANLFISFLMSIIVVICVIKINRIMNVPPELLESVRQLFLLVLFSGLFSTVCSVFGSTVFCLNRLDIKSVAMIFISVIKVVVLYLLFKLFKANIVFLGISYAVSIVLESLVYVFTTIKMMPEVKVRRRYFRFSLVRLLVSSGIWNSVNQLNTILMNGLDVWMANIMISATVSGVLSISKTMPNQLTTLVVMIANIFLPSLTIAYAKKNKAGMTEVFQSSFDILGFGMGIVIAGFIALGKPFFHQWMPTVDTNELYWLSILGMLPMFTTASTQCIGNCALLANKLRLPVLITFLRAVVGLGLVYVLVKFTNIGVYAIAGVSSIFCVVYDLAFTVPYAAYCIKIKMWYFYKNKLKFLLNLVILTAVYALIEKFMQPQGWGKIILCIAICALIGAVFNFFFFFSKEKRKELIAKGKTMLKAKKG